MGKKGKNKTKKVQKSDPISKKASSSWWTLPKWHISAVFILAIGLYANTLTHDFTQDDAIVIYDNMFTQKGVSGIPGILKYDTFYGFFKEEGKANLVSGGRYRPFTLIMFAIEWQLFGRSPFIGHLVNILLYGFLGVMIYKWLSLLFKTKDTQKEFGVIGILIATLFFIAHPIHTEAVANIKGRDEIMTFLGSVIAMWALLKNMNSPHIKWLILSFTMFFIGLMSKENAITFLGIAPLSMWMFTKKNFVSSLKSVWPLFAAAVLFLIIRFSILGMDFGGTPRELMNNPYLKIVNGTYVDFSFGEKMATIIFTLGKYILLLLFPHPLSHDYYPRAIEIMSFSDWQSILSLLLYIGLGALSIIWLKKNKVVSFAILFYLMSLSIVSNVVFPIGTNMSERFVFIPSLGFTLLMAYLLSKYVKNLKALALVSGFIVLAYGVKTVQRNFVWKNDFTLFTTDVKKNSRSAKLLNAAGGALTTEASKLKADNPLRTQYLNDAVGYLSKAIEVHPNYRNAYLLLGNAHYYNRNFESAISYLDKALAIDPGFQDAINNLPVVLRDGGRHLGQNEQNFPKAQKWLERSYQMSPNDYETCRLLGITYGIQDKHQLAINYFEKAISMKPNIAANYTSLGTAYMNSGNQEKAMEAFNKAVELDPNALKQFNKK